MTFDPLFDLRRLLGDFTRLEFDDAQLRRLLMQGATDAARRGLLVQEQEVLDLQVGVIEYPLHPRWVQTFAILHEEVQSYLAMKDQASVTWYLWVSDQGSLVWSSTRPAGADLTPATIPYWFQWTTPDTSIRYLYPSLLGSTLVSDTQPPIGTGMTLTLELQARLRGRWLSSISNEESNVLTAFAPGTPGLRLSPQDAHTMTLIIAEAFGRFGRIAPDIPPGPPQAVTVWKGRMWVTPTPDAQYQLDHKFFAIPLAADQPEQVFQVPEAFRRLPSWRAFPLALREQGKLEASLAVLKMFEQLLGTLAVVYRASARDSRDEVALPR